MIDLRYYILLAIIVFVAGAADKKCIPRKYNHDSVVCVCNANYCDEISKIGPLKPGLYVMYTSNMAGDRFEKQYGKFKSNNNVRIQVSDYPVLYINRTRKYHKIMGFGGSFTDSTGINILNLSPKVQQLLINSYFGENGLEYNMARVPIGGTDFSPRFYAYNELPKDDVKLSNFTLAEEDYKYKIDIIKRAQAVSKEKIHLMASTWDAPPWMKRINSGIFESQMDPKYYQTWADYHIRFLEEYEKSGILFQSLTLGNEAAIALLPIMIIENFISWNPLDQAKWLVENLGPTLRKSKYRDILIVAGDDQRIFLPFWIDQMATVEGALDYIDGIAVHWYTNGYAPITLMENLHEKYPDKFIISNEASLSGMAKLMWDIEIVQLGSWEKAERYIVDIFEDLNCWHVGWIDWNLVLNMKGGPNWSKNYVDAALIVNEENDEFLKQPIFYVMGHFSKFIPRNSIKIDIEINSNKNTLHVGFLRPDGGITVVLYNPNEEKALVVLQEICKGYINLILKPKSINTILYW